MGHCLIMRKGEVHTAPVTGVLASSLAVGSTVKLMEGGTAVEYLVVNQGIPENSSLYDASCDGTWLLRKDCHSRRQWNTTTVNTYANSAINTWLNGDFFNSLGSVEQSAIKQVKVPYCPGNKSTSAKTGANGLNTKAFLLSLREIGSASGYSPDEGATIEIFSGSSGDSYKYPYLDGSKVAWFTRTPYTSSNGADAVFTIPVNGVFSTTSVMSTSGIRPALIVPSNALFDETTMLLKGVK